MDRYKIEVSIGFGVFLNQKRTHTHTQISLISHMLLQSDIPKRAAPPTPRSRRVSSLDVSKVSIGPVPRRRVPETPSKKENDATLPLHSLLDKKSLQENDLTKAQEKQLNYLKVCAINIIERSLAEVDYFSRRGDRLEKMGRRLVRITLSLSLFSLCLHTHTHTNTI